MKTCFKCLEDLPLSEFYAHPQMADQYLGKCKKCTRLDAAEDRRRNIERVRGYDRDRAKLEHRKALRTRIVARWRAKYPERRRAQGVLSYALRMERIQRPVACQRCGNVPKRIEAHHADYSKPLDVEWLCKPCHAIADRERRAA